MLFTEGVFLPFVLIVLAAYWLLRGNAPRKWILLVASYVFYGFWDWRFLGLIWLSTVIDYLLARRIALSTPPVARKYLMVSLVFNLGVLGFFKYTNFFLDSFSALALQVGWSVDSVTLDIVLPIGVSFYTFQSLSYTLDVYRREIEPARSLLDFALCIAFFPHLVAGPIVRARDILDQLAAGRTKRHVDLVWSCNLFLIGFFKKACVADNLAPLADAFFSQPRSYLSPDAWLGVAAYTAQIYCDFSGYSDMAIAVAGLFGYTLRTNFAAPYLATSITDFWRRWHTSLSTWLRDYLYIPLGGRRAGRWVAHRNLMITMLLGGLWHGASWNFVVWGGMHGLALVVHKEWLTRFGRMPALLGWVLTLGWVAFAWIPFRAPGVLETVGALQAMWGYGDGSRQLSTDGGLGWALILVLLLLGQLALRRQIATAVAVRLPDWGWGLAYGASWALLLATRRIGYVPFVYFQF